MTQDELDQLASQHGGIAGQTQTGPSQEPDPDTNGITKRGIPKERRQQHVVFKDGFHITLQPQTGDDGDTPTGEFDVVQPLTEGPKNGATSGASSSVRTVKGANGQDQIEVKDPSDPSGLTWVAVGGTVSNPDEDQIKAIQRQILEGQRNERQANDAAGRGYLTNEQVAAVNRDQQTGGAAAQNAENEKNRLVQAAHDAEVNAGLRQQEVTNQANDLGLREKAQQAQIDAQNKANALAQRRLDLDKIVQDDASKRDWAKLQYEKDWNAVQAAATNARLLFDQATEQDRKAESAATNSTTQRGQDMSSATAAADRATREGIETANRQAQAANTALTETTKQGEVGAGILEQRATNARDTLNQTLAPVEASKNFGLGGGLPAGFGQQLLGGISDWTAQLAGGADVLKTAQDMVHNANPTLAGTPAGAAWSAVLSQMLGTKQSQDAAAAGTFTPPTGTTPPGAPAAPGAPGAPTAQAPQAPNEVTAGQPTPDQYQPGSAFAQSDIPEGSNRRVLVTPDGAVHVFMPPTGSAPPDDAVDNTLGGNA